MNSITTDFKAQTPVRTALAVSILGATLLQTTPGPAAADPIPFAATHQGSSPFGVTATNYESIQEAIEKNPGRMVYLPAGDHEVSAEIKITGENGGLFGPGRIIMTDPAREIIVIKKAKGVRIRDVTLTRPEGRMDTRMAGLALLDCTDVTVEGVRILDNRSAAAALWMQSCVNCQILNNQVINYMTVSIDDRTGNPLYGYAFHCTDGTGVAVRESQGTLIQGNSVIERNMIPTRELKTKYKLGDWIKRAPQRGTLASEDGWAKGYSGNWQQGSGILVSSPLATKFTRIIGNHILNAGQGCDIHSDNLIFANNIIENASFGMKACHGSRNVVITGNQFSRNSLIGIALSPAATSSPARAATASNPAQPANTDGGHILANNIISEFGYGDTWWMWEGSTVLPVGPTPISIGVGQMPDDPPLRDVLVANNMVYDTGADQILKDGVPVVEPPRYNYAVYFVNADQKSPNGILPAPRNVRFSNNLFDPGKQGISNVPLPGVIMP